ncbi:pre-B-cell leukemia transcription factor-interacting protein 1 [Varanus komodoensis]|nr:pre-B-cell leukemia transcription factor-interacting protein 1 [Varanus komodoensis]XP_044304727.1 pre-B-cell leukemia transcription factor-interacting protein 1 [Varanus komodoensis]XP_044304728.1 pre-B-cell leukemia transcription factor-interacting protein 1 [Varanus komodoensis]
MADNLDSRELENSSWVIAGSEALHVEDLGLETSEVAEPAMEDSQVSISECEFPNEHPDLEESETKGPEAALDPSPEEKSSVGVPRIPESTHSSPQQLKELGGHDAEGGSVPVTQEAHQTHETCLQKEAAKAPSSGEEPVAKSRDVEGLRRRKGRDVQAVGPGALPDQDEEDVRGEILGSKWLLGLLVLVGLGLLVALGVVVDSDDGPMDILGAWPSADTQEPHPGTDGKDGPAAPLPASPGDAKLQRAKEALRLAGHPGDPQSLEAVGLMLDKLAKENQDIRLMQAELRAQKEELETLLRKSEGEALEVTSRQQDLAAENARLTEALQRETASLQAAQTELRLLREKLQGLGEAGNGRPQQRPEEEPAPDRHRHKPERPEAELQRLRALLASVQRDLARTHQKLPPGSEAEGLRAELSGVEQRLGQALEGAEGTKLVWRDSLKVRRGKEKAWRRRLDGPQEHRPSHPDEGPDRQHRSQHPAHKAPRAASEGRPRPRKPQGGKAARDGEHQRTSRKAKKPTEPGSLWEMLARRQYRAPQGCSGIAECAQQEGLAPVLKAKFLPLVQSYLAGLGWAEHYEGLAAALSTFFGSNGTFAHDRLSFVDFLDEVEDALEELAELLGVSKEDVDNFEEMALTQLEAAPWGRFAQRDRGQQPAKEWSREGHARKNGRENLSRNHS